MGTATSVMGGTDDCDTYFYVHTLAQAPGGKLGLLTPERIDLPGRRSADGPPEAREN
jgi:hypothetical protein